MCAAPGRQEADHAEPVPVDLPEAVGHHVRDVEHAPVRRELDVLGHRAGAQAQRPHDTLLLHVDLDQLAGELATRDQVAAVRGEVDVVDASALHRQRIPEAEGMGVAKVEPVKRLGDDDREAPVGREVHVVRIVDRDRGARLAASAGRSA